MRKELEIGKKNLHQKWQQDREGGGIKMPTRLMEFKNGFQMSEEKIKNLAEKLIKSMMSELPKEIQTYEGVTYMLKMMNERLKITNHHPNDHAASAKSNALTSDSH